jgi:C-8 sterol isomerase
MSTSFDYYFAQMPFQSTVVGELSVKILTVALAVLIAFFTAFKVRLVRGLQFNVEDLHAIVKKAVGKPLPEAFDYINDELEKKYPGYFVNKKDRKWVLFNGGGAMGQMCVLHASLSEYIIFYGSPLYSQGHSGRYLMDVYDFMIQGETKTYFAGEFKATTYKAGEYSILPMLSSKGYCCEGDSWMVEYARGVIALGLPYFICSSFFVTVDLVPWAKTVYIVAKNILYNIIVNRKL